MLARTHARTHGVHGLQLRRGLYWPARAQAQYGPSTLFARAVLLRNAVTTLCHDEARDAARVCG